MTDILSPRRCRFANVSKQYATPCTESGKTTRTGVIQKAVRKKGRPPANFRRNSPPLFTLQTSGSISVQYAGILVLILQLQPDPLGELTKLEMIYQIEINHIGIIEDSFRLGTAQQGGTGYGRNLFPGIIERIPDTAGQRKILHGFTGQFDGGHAGYVLRGLSDKRLLAGLIKQLQAPFPVSQIQRRNDRISRMTPPGTIPLILLIKDFGKQSEPEYLAGKRIPLHEKAAFHVLGTVQITKSFNDVRTIGRNTGAMAFLAYEYPHSAFSTHFLNPLKYDNVKS